MNSRTGRLLRGVAALTFLTAALPAWSAPVAVDTTSPANGITDLYSATFDGALTNCTPSDPSWCPFFSGKPGPGRNIVITPTPTGAINAVPLGITPVPASGSYLDLTLNGPRTQVTLSGGTIALPPITLTIQGGTANATVVNVGGAGVVFSAAPQVAALDANGRAEFLVNLAPATAVDFSTFSVITGAPNGSCSGPLCAIIPILTLDMVRYRLVVDYSADYSSFTADFIGATANNSILAVTMNSEGAAVPGIRVRLDAHNQRSASGVLSTLKWAACSPVLATNPCLSTSASAGGIWSNANATPSNAVWTWDAATGILSMKGLFQSTVFISSNANGSPVISDRVVDLVIDTTSNTTTAASYRCVEGTFLSSVGANGCLNTNLGDDFTSNSSALYDVNGNALCVQRTVGGDDVSNGNTRGVTSVAAAAPCDAQDGAFDLWEVQLDNTATGGQLIVRNSVPIDQAGANFLTFTAVPDAVNDTASGLRDAPVTIDVLANDTAFADPVTVTATNGTHGTVVVNGSPGSQAGIDVTYTPGPGFVGTDTFTYTVLDLNAATDTATVTVTVTDPVVPDTTPDPFAFDDQAGVAVSAVVTSVPVTITGINVPAPISVTDGEYSINGGAFTSVAGTVANGNPVRVRHTSSGAPGTAVDTVLTVGGVSDTFTSTTLQYAIDDTATTVQDQPVLIDVLQNDNGLAATVYVGIWTDPVHGTATVSGVPGSPAGVRITYTPAPGYVGPDSFEYWVESGLIVDYAEVRLTVTSADLDGDGVTNALDNCTLVANPGQCDSDGDGYGNRCDGDLTGNGVTNAQDGVVMRGRLGRASIAPTYDAADLNCSGAVNAQDTTLFRKLLGKPPGPSALHP